LMQSGLSADLSSLGRHVRFFHSEYEMREHLPCKLYKIDKRFDLVQRDHAHDYYQIWYVVQGKFKHCMNGEEYLMVAGNLFVIPPYTVHRVTWEPGAVEIIGCEFLPEFIGDDRHLLEKLPSVFEKIPLKIILTSSLNHRIHQILEEMLDEYTEQRSYYEPLLKGNMLRLVSMITRELRNDELKDMGDKLDKYRPMINVAVDYIHQHFTEEIRLDHMCKVAMLSKTYFCDLFKYFTGKTLTDYVADLRLKYAMELLLQPQRTVTDVCYKAGFKDLAYFSRLFKKHSGMSPSQYKKHASILPKA